MSTNQESGVTEEAAFDKLESLLSGNQPKNGQDHEDVEDQDAESSPDEPEEQTEPEAKAEDPQSDPLEEVEIEGEVFQMPAKVKKLVEMGTGFYAKTQALAEQRKAVEQQQVFLKQQGELMAVGFKEAVTLEEIRGRIAQFDQLDWHALVDQDPTQATKLNLTLQQLQRQYVAQEAKLGEIVKKHDATQAEADRHLVAEGKAAIKRAIPSWSYSLAQQVFETGKALGYTEAELESNRDPKLMLALHDATQWRKLQASKSTVTKKVQNVSAVKTTARTTPGTQSAGDLKTARARLAKTGKDSDAEDYLNRLFKVK
jgi:hypothetical protein